MRPRCVDGRGAGQYPVGAVAPRLPHLDYETTIHSRGPCRVGEGTPQLLTQALAPDLRAAAAGSDHLAKVINIASIDGISVNPQETCSYHASKAGLIHLTKRMALRLIGDGIVANGIAPGAFASDMNRVARDHADALSAASRPVASVTPKTWPPPPSTSPHAPATTWWGA